MGGCFLSCRVSLPFHLCFVVVGLVLAVVYLEAGSCNTVCLSNSVEAGGGLYFLSISLEAGNLEAVKDNLPDVLLLLEARGPGRSKPTSLEARGPGRSKPTPFEARGPGRSKPTPFEARGPGYSKPTPIF